MNTLFKLKPMNFYSNCVRIIIEFLSKKLTRLSKCYENYENTYNVLFLH